MQQRTEVILGAGVLALLMAGGILLGARDNPPGQRDTRPSAFLAGPLGARGIAEALERRQVPVERSRRSFRRLVSDTLPAGRTGFLFLDPGRPIEGRDLELVRAWNDASPNHALLLAGPGTADLMRCYGVGLDWRHLDSLPVRPPTGAPGPWPLVAGILANSLDTVITDSSRLSDVGIRGCVVPPTERAETLLMSGTGRVVGLRLVRGDKGGDVVVFSDAGLFRNRAVRETPAGPFLLGLLVRDFARVRFEESRQGFGEGGSLAGATLAWSRRSPLGWGLWQAALVGTLALAAGAIRFGPARRVLERKRRSPLEHVRALATALAAARGHDVAIRSIVEGLRRRLQPAGQRARGDPGSWLSLLRVNVRSARAREAVRQLQQLTTPGQTPDGVLRAAHAVEDVWEELRP